MKNKKVYVIADNEYWKKVKHDYNPLFNVTDYEYTDKPSLFTVIFEKNAQFFFPLKKFKKHFFMIHLFAKLLNKIYNHKSEQMLYDFFRTNFDISKNLFIGHDVPVLSLNISHISFKIAARFNFVTINFSIPYPKTLIEKIKYNLLNEKDGFYISNNFYGNIIITNTFNYEYLSLIKIKFPNANIYVKFVDMIVQKKDISGLYENYCKEHAELIAYIKENFSKAQSIVKKFYSYSQVDSKLFDLIFEPNGVNFKKYNNTSEVNNSYIFFAAVCDDRIRAESVLKICRKLIKCKLPFKFVLVNLDEDIKNRFKQLNLDNEKCSISFERQPYQELLNLTLAASVLIDLYRITPDEGYSFRISEALAMNKKIITNRIDLDKEEFYSPELILINETLDFRDEDLVKLFNSKRVNYDYDKVKMFDTKNQMLSCIVDKD